jgi:hypothetical protein
VVRRSVRFRILVGRIGRLKTAFDSLTSYFCERLDWVMPLGCNKLLTNLLTLRLRFDLWPLLEWPLSVVCFCWPAGCRFARKLIGTRR